MNTQILVGRVFINFKKPEIDRIMKKHDLQKIGVPDSCLGAAFELCSLASRRGVFRSNKPSEYIRTILDKPSEWIDDDLAGSFAKSLKSNENIIHTVSVPSPYKIWGEDGIDLGAIEQLRSACSLPIAVRGALMPDAHVGYGLPIGGVLATLNAVIPFAVGVDIACRMKLTVFDVPSTDLDNHSEKFERMLIENTLFGAGKDFTRSGRKNHSVMDKDWNVSPVTKRQKDTAWKQLGTSGGGNHFAEFGIVEILAPNLQSDLEIGKRYVALMTHSGSRGTGSKICTYYSKIAQTKVLPKWKNLAWLDLGTEEGQEYWAAMNLMGEYSAANHDIIHQQISKEIGSPIYQVENHHNFAWKEIHDGMEVIVHRKGATPAGKGVVGVIPGSMADPAYIVSGLGDESSLMSASHGAGRKMARREAKEKMKWEFWREELKRRGVRLLGGGIDEVPGVYKDINDVMKRQQDLVKILARFQPKIVRMSDDGIAEEA